MKTLKIYLDDVDLAMLADLKKANSQYRDLSRMLSSMIHDDHAKRFKK
jgi:hypothetical protein